MRILHLEYDQYPQSAIELLNSKHEVVSLNCNSQIELYQHLEKNQYQVIFTRLGISIDKKCIDSQKDELQFIATSTTGLNHIDTDYANARGIQVISLKGDVDFLSRVKSTAEHTWGLLLMLIRHLDQASQSVKKGEWKRDPFISDELGEKTLGVIGYGRLGKIVAKYGIAFGMNVLVHDIEPNKTLELIDGVFSSDLDNLLEKSDVVVLLVNYEKSNERLIGAKEFNQMKKDAYFINTSRGELIDEDALISTLKSGKIKGAAIDVLNGDSSWAGKVEGKKEILNYANAFNNLIITPHMAGYGIDSIARTRQFLTEKILKLI